MEYMLFFYFRIECCNFLYLLINIIYYFVVDNIVFGIMDFVSKVLYIVDFCKY